MTYTATSRLTDHLLHHRTRDARGRFTQLPIPHETWPDPRYLSEALNSYDEAADFLMQHYPEYLVVCWHGELIDILPDHFVSHTLTYDILRHRYHCPPVPPRPTVRAEHDECLTCPRWISRLIPRNQLNWSQMKQVEVDIYCRDLRLDIRCLIMEDSAQCPERMKLLWGLAKERTDVDESMLIKLSLPHGGEMIL